jgi:hypothetical protein
MVANLRHHAADRLGVRCLICGDANGKRVAVTRGAALGSDTVRDAHGCHRQVETNLILRSEDIHVADTSAPCYAASEHWDARLRRLSARQANRRRKFACRICHPQDTTRSRSLRECRSKCSSRSIAARWHSTRSIHCLDRSPTRSARFDPQRNVELREPQEGRWTQRSTASVRLCARHFRMMC